jgi:hypothetical protein
VSTDQTERTGIEAIRATIARLGWFVREPVRPDYGVDLFLETAEDERPSGRLLALQVKSGRSYLGEGGDDIPFRANQKHIDYWMGHSLPVVVVLYDPETDRAYWQAVTEDTAESTGKGWKLIVPRSQVLDTDSLSALSELAAPRPPETSKEAEELSRLRSDLTWMEMLETGGSVRLDANEWINKTSGRGDLLLTAQPAHGGDPIERGFIVFLGLRPYAQALPELFPWAELQADETLLEQHDEEEWMAETGMWDSEEKRYIGNSETFAEWLAGRYPDGNLRPYSNSAGEVDHWRLSLTLNDLGHGVLAFERHLSP